MAFLDLLWLAGVTPKERVAMGLSPKTRCQGLWGHGIVTPTDPLWGWPEVAVTLR